MAGLLLGVYSPSKGGAVPAEGYTANGVHFNGSSYAEKSTAMSVSGGDKAIISLWAKNSSSSGSNYTIFYQYDAGQFKGLLIRFDSSGYFHIYGNTAASTHLNYQSSTTYSSMSGYSHFLTTFDLSATTQQLYVDSADDLGTVTTNSSGTLAFNAASTFICCNYSNVEKFVGDLADVQIWFGQTLDISNSSNRALFISGGNPVDPATAAATLGTQDVLLNSATSNNTWFTNAGGAGGFTDTIAGTITDASDPP